MGYFNNGNFFTAIRLYFERLPNALLITAIITAGAVLIGLVIGLLLAVVYLSPNKLLSSGAQSLIYFFRATPGPPFLYLVYFGIISLVAPIDPIQAGIIALGVLLAAPMAELYRSGIQSVNVGLIEAGRALGMSQILIYRRIVLPIASRIMLPSIGQLTVGTLINSSLVAIIGVKDLTGMSRNLVYSWFSTELFVIVAITYFILSFPMSRALTVIERRLRAIY